MSALTTRSKLMIKTFSQDFLITSTWLVASAALTFQLPSPPCPLTLIRHSQPKFAPYMCEQDKDNSGQVRGLACKQKGAIIFPIELDLQTHSTPAVAANIKQVSKILLVIIFIFKYATDAQQCINYNYWHMTHCFTHVLFLVIPD